MDERFAYEINIYDEDGKNILNREWVQEEETAKSEALKLLRKYGPQRVKLLRLVWEGVSLNPNKNPLRIEQISIIDENDPEVMEYLRLHEKFKDLIIP